MSAVFLPALDTAGLPYPPIQCAARAYTHDVSGLSKAAAVFVQLLDCPQGTNAITELSLGIRSTAVVREILMNHTGYINVWRTRPLPGRPSLALPEREPGILVLAWFGTLLLLGVPNAVALTWALGGCK
jgi:hypothetical protein